MMPNGFEINGNLYDYEHIEIFEQTVYKIIKEFQQLFGEDILDRLPLYIDNSIKGGGYTPITDVVLHSYISIKLHIDDFSDIELITYQFAHEMCHYVYRCLIGINKKNAEEYEESICSAMSLCFLSRYRDNFKNWCNHVRHLKNNGYRQGYYIALECNFTPIQLRNKILLELDEYRKIAL